MTEPYEYYFAKNRDSFLGKVRDYPMLAEADEIKYIKAWQKMGDQKSVHALVTSHLRLIVKLANNFRRYGLSHEDLISEGCVGMMQAIDRFDLEKGFRLSTYAKWWIRAAMQEYIMRSWSLVRIGTTVGQKKLFFNLRRMKLELAGTNEGQLTDADIETIMDRLKVARHEVMSMDGRMSNPDSPLNDVLGDEDKTEWQDRLVDDSDTPEESVLHFDEKAFQLGLLNKALDVLTERVRQIEHSVFLKIQKIVTAEHNRIEAMTCA